MANKEPPVTSGRNPPRRRRKSKGDVIKGEKNDKIEQKSRVALKSNRHDRKQQHPAPAEADSEPAGAEELGGSGGKMGRRPTRATDLHVDFHPYRHPVNSPALTPTQALAVAMCNSLLDSPAFCTRRRSSHTIGSAHAARSTKSKPPTPKAHASNDLHLAGDEHDVTTEVSKAVMWWVHGLCHPSGAEVKPDTKRKFKECLFRELEFRCAYHWYPADPQRGSGYRSVLHDFNVDVALARACAACDLPTTALPAHQIMFVNPGEVKVVDTHSNVSQILYLASHQAVDTQGETKRGNNAILKAFNSQLAKKKHQESSMMPPPPARKAHSY